MITFSNRKINLIQVVRPERSEYRRLTVIVEFESLQCFNNFNKTNVINPRRTHFHTYTLKYPRIYVLFTQKYTNINTHTNPISHIFAIIDKMTLNHAKQTNTIIGRNVMGWRTKRQGVADETSRGGGLNNRTKRAIFGRTGNRTKRVATNIRDITLMLSLHKMVRGIRTYAISYRH